ncbi:MAG: hypothetical protein H0T94_00870 [Acidimicrobiia bacterium]|nr:hypothetical protein [Acidimicrobiia bacterium]
MKQVYLPMIVPGVPTIRLHEIRHTHGTLLIKAGMSVKVVSERLGHGNPGLHHTFDVSVPCGEVFAEAADLGEAVTAQSERRGLVFGVASVGVGAEGEEMGN